MVNMTAPVWLDRNIISDFLPEIDCLSVMRETFRAFGSGQAVQPPQTLTEFPEGKGDFITYFGALPDEGVFGVKLSPYLIRENGGKVTAATLLMDMVTGAPVCLCDSLALTTERTAATTALAVDLLARPDAADLTIIGSGDVALAHLRHALSLRNWKRIRMSSRAIMSRKEEVLAKIGAITPIVELIAETGEAVRGADVVMLCTSSGTPVLHNNQIEPAMLITSISTNIANAHEVQPQSLLNMTVYCDARATTPVIAGEMKLAAEYGWSSDSIAGDLGELICRRVLSTDPDKAVFFRSVGLGIEDIALAAAIYKRFVQR